MKSIFITFCLFVFTYQLNAQNRIQSIDDGINQLEHSQTQVESYLENLGFSYTSHYKNVYDYHKNTQIGTFEYSVGYRNKKVDMVHWLEHLMYLPSIQRELFQIGFEQVNTDTQTNIIGFKNISKNLTATIIVRPETNDLLVTIGILNQAKSKHVAAGQVKNTTALVGHLPNAKEAITSKHYNYLTKLSKAQIIAHYKALGAKNFFDDGFYMSFLEDGSDSCISVQITKKGSMNQLHFSMECD